ncbi:MAG: aspartate 1-decarboxylase [Caldisericaceae bacterium]
MKREMLKSKIHRAIVTSKNIAYEGSITIDKHLCNNADIKEFEKVEIYDVNNGERFSTYVLFGEAFSGCIELNGAAARRVEIGDVIIIASYGQYDDSDINDFKPKIVLVNSENKAKEVL